MPCGVPSTGDASKPRNSTSGWNGSASVSLKLTPLTCWSNAPSTLAAPLRIRSLDLKVWLLTGILSLSTLKPGTGVTPTTTISLNGGAWSEPASIAWTVIVPARHSTANPMDLQADRDRTILRGMAFPLGYRLGLRAQLQR